MHESQLTKHGTRTCGDSRTYHVFQWLKSWAGVHQRPGGPDADGIIQNQ